VQQKIGLGMCGNRQAIVLAFQERAFHFVVGVTVFFLVIVASADFLSCVPANVYGYAALVGYTLSAGKLDALTAADNSNHCSSSRSPRSWALCSAT
jgi:uncharacterized protein DUF1097